MFSTHLSKKKIKRAAQAVLLLFLLTHNFSMHSFLQMSSAAQHEHVGLLAKLAHLHSNSFFTNSFLEMSSAAQHEHVGPSARLTLLHSNPLLKCPLLK